MKAKPAAKKTTATKKKKMVACTDATEARLALATQVARIKETHQRIKETHHHQAAELEEIEEIEKMVRSNTARAALNRVKKTHAEHEAQINEARAVITRLTKIEQATKKIEQAVAEMEVWAQQEVQRLTADLTAGIEARAKALFEQEFAE